MSLSSSLTVLVVVALFFLASCGYGHKSYQPDQAVKLDPCVPLVLEVDDYGRFWDRKAGDTILETLRTASQDTNTVVVVFIHGWHHNAAKDDKNLLDFQKSLKALQKKLGDSSYVQARKGLRLKEDLNVIGLYVGWRGRSLPWYLDYLTFWGRKAAAERVGNGDLREFLLRLHELYLAQNSAPSDSSGDRRLMGLVTIGHSFGGQVLYRAVSEKLEAELISPHTKIAGGSDAFQTPQPSNPIGGFGDITVLVNPALEAFQYERIDRLSRQLRFNEYQTPVLLTVSAENDMARSFFFPAGRYFDRIFRPSFQSDEDEALWSTALGEYEPHRTHTMEPFLGGKDTIIDPVNEDCTINKVDFTASLILDETKLTPINSSHQAYSPVIVAYASKDLVDGHNGIFRNKFGLFLTDYIAFIEGKRMLLKTGCRLNGQS